MIFCKTRTIIFKKRLLNRIREPTFVNRHHRDLTVIYLKSMCTKAVYLLYN